MPMPRLPGGICVASTPSSNNVPLLGSVRPEIICSSVVLPDPDGPSSVRNSPARTCRSVGASATLAIALAQADGFQFVAHGILSPRSRR